MKLALFALFPAHLLPALLLAQAPITYRISTVAGIPWSIAGPAQTPNVMLKTPFGVAYDKSGNLYVANYEMHLVRKIAPDGKVTTVAGDGADSRVIFANDPASSARRLTFPRAIAVDGDRYLYISEPNVQRIKRLNLETNELTTIVGGRGNGFAPDGTVGTSAQLLEVLGLAVDGQGNLIIAETGSHRIRRWTAATGVLSTLAGSGTAGFAGDDGPATAARLNRPAGVVVHPSGDIYFFDFENRRVRRIRGGTITTIAGTPTGTVSSGPGLQVNFQTSTGIALDAEGRNLYITDERSHRIFKLQLSDAAVSVVAGTGTAGRVAAEGTPAITTALFTPTNIVVDPQGAVVFADSNNHRIRRIALDGTIRTLAGMNRFAYNGSVAPAEAVFDSPSSVRVAPNGSLVVADTGNCLIRSIVTNVVSILAGVQGSCGLDSAINSAVMDPDRNVFWLGQRGLVYRPATGGAFTGTLRGGPPGAGLILTNDGSSLQYLDANQSQFFTVTRAVAMGTQQLMTFLQFGVPGRGYVDGGQFQARFNVPMEMAYDSKGDRYVADLGNSAIRRIRGFDTTTYAKLGFLPFSVAVDSEDRVWTATPGGIFRLNAEGEIAAGVASELGGYSPDGAAGLSVVIGQPRSLFGGRNGVLYFVEQAYNVIRQLTPVAVQRVEIVDGNNQVGAPGAKLPAPLRVRVMGTDGQPLSGMPIIFKGANATLRLPPFVLTDLEGIASLEVTLPTPATSTTITASLGQLPAVTFTVTVPAAAQVTEVAIAPQYGGGTRIAGGSWIEVRGTGLASDSAENLEGTEGPLGGVRLLMNGAPALLQSVSPTRIAAVAPAGLSVGNVEIAVMAAGSAEPAALTVEGVAVAPALLAPVELRAEGRQFVFARIDAETLAGPVGLAPGMRPAKSGEKLTLTGTGFGPAAPSVVEVKFGERTATVEAVTAGPLGSYQIVVTVPEGMAGEARVSMTVDGVSVTQELSTMLE